MGRKTGRRQLKRQPSPAFWPIHRKDHVWAPNTHPGPHSKHLSLPLVIVMREILGHAMTAKEAIHIIHGGQVKVDGIIRRDHRYPVGLMDVIQIEKAGQIFRVLPKPNRGLTLVPVPQKEVGFKLCKIIDKTTLSKGRTQLNLHDGRNLILDTRTPVASKTAPEFLVGGTVQLGFPGQKVIKYIPFQVGSQGLVLDGHNEGYYGKIAEINEGSYARPKIVKIETANFAFETPARYVIPVGTDAPLVSLEATK